MSKGEGTDPGPRTGVLPTARRPNVSYRPLAVLRYGSGHRKRGLKTTIDRPAPCSPAGAEPDAARPAALRIRVALPRSRTHPKDRHRRTPLDAPGVSSGVGASQVSPPVLIEPVPKEARTEGAERGTHPGHRRR